MKALLAWMLVLAAALSGQAAPKAVPLEVSGDTVTVVKSFPARITAAPGADFYLWSVPEGIKATKSRNVLTIASAPDGAYRIGVSAITVVVDFDKKTKDVIEDAGTVEVVFGTPAPPGPKPPDPGPSPTGPLRVLVVHETAEAAKLPAGQFAIIYGDTFRGTLRDRTDKSGPDGRGWNIWDKDQDATAAAKFWQDALKRSRPSVPYIHLFKGEKLAYEGPLPATVEEATAIVTKYAGG